MGKKYFLRARKGGALAGSHWLWVAGFAALLVLFGLVRPVALARAAAGEQPAAAGNQPAATEGQPAAQSAAQEQNHAIIYVFWGNGCPHCEQARPVIAEIAARYPGTEVKEFEVWYDEANQQKFKQFAAEYGIQPGSVPTIFIGTKSWIGWNDKIASEVEYEVALCDAGSCPDPEVDDIQAAMAAEQSGNVSESHLIKLPLIGSYVNLDHQSLLISTLLISFIDGVNPCSVWVLSMLMALTLHTGSRRKILIIGAVFLTVTAGVYALFIAGLFTFLSIVSFVGWIRVAVALLSLAFAVINIKDYFWYKEGVSLTISDDVKPGIYQRMRRVVQVSDSFPAMVAATVGLSAGVSLVEFSCTAGFPVLWTNLLTSQGVTGLTSLTFLSLLAVYLIIYQADEMVIFGTVVFTLKASRLEEKHGRILKLIGGMLMLTLAGVMLINPNLMNNISSSLLIFALAFGLTLLVLLVHRRLLPAMGIWVGSEARPGKENKARRRTRR